MEGSLALRSYYTRAGFIQVGRRDFDGPWHSAVLLEKQLASGRHEPHSRRPIPTGPERIPIAADECGRKVRRLEVPDKLLSRLVWLERGDEARCGRDYTSAYRFHPFERRRRCGAPRRRGDVHRRRQQRGKISASAGDSCKAQQC